MQIRFNPSKIKSLSGRYLSDLSTKRYDEETKIINLKKKIQKARFMTKEELVLVGKWKTTTIHPILRTSDFRFQYLFLKPVWSLH